MRLFFQGPAWSQCVLPPRRTELETEVPGSDRSSERDPCGRRLAHKPAQRGESHYGHASANRHDLQNRMESFWSFWSSYAPLRVELRRRSWSSKTVVWLRRCFKFCSLFCNASTRRCSRRLLCCRLAAVASGAAAAIFSASAGEIPLPSAKVRTLFVRLPFVPNPCSEGPVLRDGAASASALCASTNWLNCSVRRSISTRSLTRPFHNCAMRDAAMSSRLFIARH